MQFVLFFFGAAIGSFLNVVSLRYKPNRFLLSRALGGRSHCPKCKKNLRWFELAPILSFIIQGGRCRRCGARLSFQYPIVEILAGLIFVFVPARLGANFPSSTLWILVFLALLAISLIDLRQSIIPDEANIFLLILGFLILTIGQALRWHRNLYSFGQNPWLSGAIAATSAGTFFWFLIFITRGRGMGAGDLKLAIPLGLIFGWPETPLLIGLSFIIGAVFGVGAIIFRGKNMKSAIPFGPFLAASAAIVFFWGGAILNFYSSAFSL